MTDRVKPGDPVFDELVAKFQSVASSRYVEDPSHRLPTRFIRSETGLRFDELKRGDQIDTLSDSVHWDYYTEKGLSAAQAGIILSNVRDGKPKEKWLDGIFDEAALERQRVEGFKAMVEDSKHRPDIRLFEEMDGDRLPWAELSATAKLGYIARYAAFSGVGFEPFAEMVKDATGKKADLRGADLRKVYFEGADMRAGASERQGHSMSERLFSEAEKQETTRNQLVRVHFEAHRDLMWADAMEPRLKGYDLNSDAMKPYREAWNAFVEERDWDWWWDETRRSSNEELKAQIGECLEELTSREKRQSVHGHADPGRQSFHEILNGNSVQPAAEPAHSQTRSIER